MGQDEKVQPNELDELQQKFANHRFEEDGEEDKPDSSKDSPDAKKLAITTEDGKRVMLVAARSRVKQVAGSIARTIRDQDSEPPILSAVGAASVNQAIKSIAIARDFVEEDGKDLVVEVERRPQAQVKDVLVFTLSKVNRGEIDVKAEDNVVDMRSASQSQPSALAGAIAKNVRENKRPRITAIGQKPVFKAVCAVALARKYLRKEKLDIDIVPLFTHVNFENGSEANAMQLIVLSRKIDG